MQASKNKPTRLKKYQEITHNGKNYQFIDYWHVESIKCYRIHRGKTLTRTYIYLDGVAV